VNPNYESITDVADLVSAARAHDLWVMPWTVDDPGAIRDLAESGATGVFTNDPAAAREALAG
jgi:glycerophosphoryl diester phosphodiesterase